MHFQLAAAAAVLACTGHVAARAEPYQPFMMAVPGMSLARRDTGGYQPDSEKCLGADGDTCGQVCGQDFVQCSAEGSAVYCFNPAASQSCCSDGNACEDGYYCAHDSSEKTWCCPDEMDLDECAASFKISGGLETATAPATTTTSTSTSSSTTEVSTTEVSTTVVITTTEEISTTWYPISSGTTTAWTGANSTYTSAFLTSTSSSYVVSQVPDVTESAPATVTTNAAGSSSVSLLLLAAAGIVALL